MPNLKPLAQDRAKEILGQIRYHSGRGNINRYLTEGEHNWLMFEMRRTKGPWRHDLYRSYTSIIYDVAYPPVTTP